MANWLINNGKGGREGMEKKIFSFSGICPGGSWVYSKHELFMKLIQNGESRYVTFALTSRRCKSEVTLLVLGETSNKG